MQSLLIVIRLDTLHALQSRFLFYIPDIIYNSRAWYFALHRKKASRASYIPACILLQLFTHILVCYGIILNANILICFFPNNFVWLKSYLNVWIIYILLWKEKCFHRHVHHKFSRLFGFGDCFVLFEKLQLHSKALWALQVYIIRRFIMDHLSFPSMIHWWVEMLNFDIILIVLYLYSVCSH